MWATGIYALKEFNRFHSPDVVFLIETKNKGDKLRRFARSMGFTGCLMMDPEGIAGEYQVLTGLWPNRSRNFFMRLHNCQA